MIFFKLGCARESIATWLDMYDEEGLKGLTKLVKREKVQSLSKEQKAEMKVMFDELRADIKNLKTHFFFSPSAYSLTGKGVSDIEAINLDSNTKEALADWKYWLDNMDYGF
ncbi:MAG: calcium-binding protein [Pseudanabaena sp.]